MNEHTQITDLQGLVNSSGYPFLLRVEKEVKSTRHFHEWEVLAREHPWTVARNGQTKYIDLVLGHGVLRIVIKFKITENANWVFLLPGNNQSAQMRATWISTADKEEHRTGAYEFYPTPESFISEFCVVDAKSERDYLKLEESCSSLLDSIEALAVEEVSMTSDSSDRPGFIYFPLIVTNANLQVCNFDMSEISLDEGRLASGNFSPVPYIRFRKSLATRLTRTTQADSIQAANQNRVRTVMIIKANFFPEFLQNWKLTLNESNQPPW